MILLTIHHAKSWWRFFGVYLWKSICTILHQPRAIRLNWPAQLFTDMVLYSACCVRYQILRSKMSLSPLSFDTNGSCQWFHHQFTHKRPKIDCGLTTSESHLSFWRRRSCSKPQCPIINPHLQRFAPHSLTFMFHAWSAFEKHFMVTAITLSSSGHMCRALKSFFAERKKIAPKTGFLRVTSSMWNSFNIHFVLLSVERRGLDR